MLERPRPSLELTAGRVPGSSIEVPSHQPSSDLQSVQLDPKNSRQLTLGLLISGSPKIGDDECFRRVRTWEVRRSSQREVMWLLYGLRI